MATAGSPDGLVIGGTVVDANVAASGDTCSIPGDFVLLLVSVGGTPTNLTLTTPNTVSGLAIADDVVTCIANKITAIPLPRSLFADANGNVAMAWSSTTSVTWGALTF